MCIIPFPNRPWFLYVYSTSLLKTQWKKESNISFFHSVFYPFGKLLVIFIKFEIVVCKLFEFGSLNYMVLERVKPSKPSTTGNYGSIKPILSKNRLNHDGSCPLTWRKFKDSKKILFFVSGRGLCRLMWVDFFFFFFHKCIKPPFHRVWLICVGKVYI